MFENFTDRARRVIVQAQDEATKASRPIDTSHLFIGLLTEGQSLAAQLLQDQGISRESARVLAADEPAGEVPDGEVVLIDDANAAIASATAISSELGHEFVAPEHLLLGILRTKSGGARSIIDGLSDQLGEAFVERLMDQIRNDQDASAGKRCSKCGASVAGFGKVQEVSLKVVDGKLINVYAYYCGECKSTYGLVRGEE